MRPVCRYAHTTNTQPAYAHGVCAVVDTAYAVPDIRHVRIRAHETSRVSNRCDFAHTVDTRDAQRLRRGHGDLPGGQGAVPTGRSDAPKTLTGQRFKAKSSRMDTDEPTRRERVVPAGRRGILGHLRETVRPFPPARLRAIRPVTGAVPGAPGLSDRCRRDVCHAASDGAPFHPGHGACRALVERKDRSWVVAFRRHRETRDEHRFDTPPRKTSRRERRRCP